MPDEATRPTVLVVEDEWILRETIAEHLRNGGCDVIVAGCGEDALTILAERDGFDVLLTDIRLGGPVNGWDVAEACRDAHPDMKVIYVSGAAITPMRKVSSSLYFDKPYQSDAILAACCAER